MYDGEPRSTGVGRWADPMTFSDVKHLYGTLPGERMSSRVDDGKDVPADWNRRVSEGRGQVLGSRLRPRSRPGSRLRRRTA